MQRFDFKLQRVLDFRQKVEDQKKGELAKAKENETRQKELLTELICEKQNKSKDFDTFKSSFEFQCYARYIESMENKINFQNQNVVSAQRESENKNTELLRAATDRKIMEKLEDKQKDEFEIEIQKKEQSLNDDFAIYTYLKRARG